MACLQVTCFFLWVDVMAQTLMNELLEGHEEWLPILPQTVAAAARAPARERLPLLPLTVAAAARAPAEETEDGALIDREVVVELRRVNQKIMKLEDQSQICNYIWAFVDGIVIALVVMLKLYENE